MHFGHGWLQKRMQIHDIYLPRNSSHFQMIPRKRDYQQSLAMKWYDMVFYCIQDQIRCLIQQTGQFISKLKSRMLERGQLPCTGTPLLQRLGPWYRSNDKHDRALSNPITSSSFREAEWTVGMWWMSPIHNPVLKGTQVRTTKIRIAQKSMCYWDSWTYRYAT